MIKNLKIKCMIPKKLIKWANQHYKRYEPKNNLYKMYAIIKYHYELELKRNKKRSKPKFDSLIYASLSSKYFEQVICKRYYIYKQILVDHGYITPKLSYVWKPGTPLFEDSTTETYTVGKVSKSYKILKNVDNDFVEMVLKFNVDHSVVAKKNTKFLESIGVQNPNIKYDQYGYRLYHNLTTTYKEIEDKDKFIYYDIKSSVPTFFKLKMIKEGIIDDPFLDLFKGDFYNNLGRLLEFSGDENEVRKQAKKVFMYIANEKRRMDKNVMRLLKEKLPLFDIMCHRKGIARDLIHDESNFINKVIVPGIDVDRILTIFDGLIIHKDDESIADEHFAKLKKEGCPIEFSKGLIPTSKKEVIDAV